MSRNRNRDDRRMKSDNFTSLNRPRSGRSHQAFATIPNYAVTNRY